MTDSQEGLPKKPTVTKGTSIEHMPPIDNVIPETPDGHYHDYHDLLITPDAPNIPGGPGSVDIDPIDNNEAYPSHRHRNVLIAVGTAATAAVALSIGLWSGLKGSGMQNLGNTLIAGAQAKPSATPTPETPSATPTPETTKPPIAQAPEAYQFNVDAATVDKLLSPNESLSAFLALPIEQRALVPLYIAENMPQFAADWYDVTGNPQDNGLPPKMTIDITPQQIVTFNGYLHRMANTLPRPNPIQNGYDLLDVNKADKMVAGYFIDPIGDPSYTAYTKEVDAFANDGGSVPTARSIAVSGNFAAATIDPTSSTEIMHDPIGAYRTIRVVEGDGSSYNVTYRWIVAANGVGVWLQQQ